MKRSLALITPVAALLSFASPAFATNTCIGPYNQLCALNTSNLGSMVSAVVQLIFAIAILAALLYLVWGGLKWLISGGDKNAVSSARDHIVAAIIGLVIIFLSYLILNVILQFFGLGGLNNVVIPNINNAAQP